MGAKVGMLGRQNKKNSSYGWLTPLYLACVLCKDLYKERYFVSDILTFIFDMERVLLQPVNSLLQLAKKVKF